jgi:plastocyanin
MHKSFSKGHTSKRRVGRLRLCSCSFTLLCMMTAAATACVGQQLTVTGRIELFRDGTTRSPDFSDAVVWLTRIGDSREAQSASGSPRSQLMQKNKSFFPHMLVVQVGYPVEFPNKDPYFHNVFSFFEGKRFDLGLYEAGSSRTVVFDREGISYIFCNIHADMSGVVVALKTPYYGVSDHKGVIAIPNVPLGRYELRVWHERALPESLDIHTRTILISEASHSLGILRITEQRTKSKDHKNKYGQDYGNATPAVPIYPRP